MFPKTLNRKLSTTLALKKLEGPNKSPRFKPPESGQKKPSLKTIPNLSPGDPPIPEEKRPQNRKPHKPEMAGNPRKNP